MDQLTSILQVAETLSEELGQAITAARPSKLITFMLLGIMGLFTVSMTDNAKAMDDVSGGA